MPYQPMPGKFIRFIIAVRRFIILSSCIKLLADPV